MNIGKMKLLLKGLTSIYKNVSQFVLAYPEVRLEASLINAIFPVKQEYFRFSDGGEKDLVFPLLRPTDFHYWKKYIGRSLKQLRKKKDEHIQIMLEAAIINCPELKTIIDVVPKISKETFIKFCENNLFYLDDELVTKAVFIIAKKFDMVRQILDLYIVNDLPWYYAISTGVFSKEDVVYGIDRTKSAAALISEQLLHNGYFDLYLKYRKTNLSLNDAVYFMLKNKSDLVSYKIKYTGFYSHATNIFLVMYFLNQLSERALKRVLLNPDNAMIFFAKLFINHRNLITKTLAKLDDSDSFLSKLKKSGLDIIEEFAKRRK